MLRARPKKPRRQRGDRWRCRGGRGGTYFMHSRSRISTDPFAPLRCRDGACRVFTAQSDISCTGAKRREMFGESQEGFEPHANETTTCEADFRTLCVLSSIWMAAVREGGGGLSPCVKIDSTRQHLTPFRLHTKKN